MKLRTQSFSESAKIRLIKRGMSIAALARRLGYNRSTVSLMIHGRRKLSGVEAAVKKELGL